MDAAFIWKLSKLGRIGSTRQRFDDDFADRLNYQYTSVLLFLFIGLIGIRQYVGKPIQCWIPQEFTRGWEEYAENYCWVANTYFAALWKRLPLMPHRRASHLVYYQWAPIVLATQALLFYLPSLIWRVGLRNSGFSVHRVLQLAAESNDLVPEVALKTVHVMARYLETCMHRQHMYRQKYCGEKPHIPTTTTASVRFRSSPSIEMQTPSGITSKSEKPSMQLPPTSSVSSTRHSVSSGGGGGGPTVSSGQYVQIPPPAYQPPSSGIQPTGRRAPPLPMLQKFHKAPPPPAPMMAGLQEVETEDFHKSSSLDTASVGAGLSEHLIKSPPSGSHLSTGSIVASEKSSSKKTTSPGRHKHKLSRPLCHWLLTCCPGGRRRLEERHKLLPPAFIGAASANTRKSHRGSRRTRGRRSWLGCCSRESGTFLTTLYCCVKCLYLINAVGQIYLMERFVGAKATFYGAAVLADLVSGRDWQQSGHFPRVTFCDMEAKKLGKNHVYTIQCVLPINMFLEKIYIFLWFWHILLTIITTASLVSWLRRLFWRRSRLKFMRHYLKVVSAVPPILDARDRQRTRQFVEEYLTPDAFFLIRMIGTNSGDLLASELTHELWLGFIGKGAQTCVPTPSAPPPMGRLCPKHSVCSCDSCSFYLSRVSGSSRPPGSRSEGRMFGVKYYPGDRSPPRQKIGPNLFQHLQMCDQAMLAPRRISIDSEHQTKFALEESIGPSSGTPAPPPTSTSLSVEDIV